ncbi:glycosyltransferase [Pseudokineococcus sp. 5B2Z-1]|uniref:glycosyltransferase family 2 protein n=1 Tax=Pseudokineococcus sp. 5B2Z-1 TaxID=3132744 RepID=UPI0030B0D17D
MPDDASVPRDVLVSVVVPVHGDRGGLRSTLEHLAAQRTRRPFEVVVVDNGDNGDVRAVAAMVPGLDVRVVREPQRGSYAARNAGVRVARGAVLAFTDADCLPRPTWLEAAVEVLEREGPGVFLGGAVSMRAFDPSRLTLAEVWQFGNDLRQDIYVRELGWAVTANLVVRRSDFEHAGLFDAHLASSGDREWGQRASRAGLRAVYAPESVVDHPTRPTMRPLLAKMRRVARGGVALERTSGRPMHPDGWRRALVPPLRSTWRRAERLRARPVDRARLVLATALVHAYRLGYEVVHRVSSRG